MSPLNFQRPPRKLLIGALAFSLIVLVAFVKRDPVWITFQSTAANYWVVCLAALATPVLFAWLGTQAKLPFLRLSLFVLAGLLALPLAPLGCVAGVRAASNGSTDPDFELLDQAVQGDTHYRLYMMHCGVPCSDDLQLVAEHEYPLVKSTRFIWTVEERNNCDFERISCDPERMICERCLVEGI